MKKVLIAFVMLCSVMLGLVIPTNQAAAFNTNCTTRFLGLPAWYDGLVNTSTCEIESPAKDEAKLRQFIWTVVANIGARDGCGWISSNRICDIWWFSVFDVFW